MKKKKVPRAVEAKQQPPKLNPFEMKSSKRKFEVLGKRDKQGKNNVIKSREEAVNKRKKTLLVEYKQLRKANTFIDRRFGEDDPRLDDEDKALARFQAQRIREAKKASKFHLSGDDGQNGRADTLTHGGRSLEELEELNSQPAELLGNLDDDILEDLVQQYHFGGGEDGGATDGEGQQRKKTKKEIMEEIIAKSKAAKAEKARQKEADEQALADLDNTFKSLVKDSTAGLAALVKPTGYDKGRKLKPETDEDAAYDRAARELVFEAKGQASERTLTADELQEKEAARLAALEAARVKRMREDTAGAAEGKDEQPQSDDDQPAAAAAASGGYAAKRARLAREAAEWENRQKRKLQASGDALDENFALSDEDEGSGSGSDSDDDAAAAAANAQEARRQAAASGDHPLQKMFRQAAAKLAAKYGVEGVQQSDSSESDDEGESSDGGEGESDSEQDQQSGSDQESDGDDGSSSDEEGDHQQQEEEELEHPTKKRKQQDKQQQVAEAAAAGSNLPAKPPAAAAAAAAAAAEVEGPLDLSYTPPVPETYQEFVALVGGRPADQLQLAIQRIRTFNAATMATDNKRKLQVFYGILVQHFAMLAGQQPTPVAHLDILTHSILQLTPEVPFYAATVARTRIEKLHDRLAAHLADPLAAGPLLGWPGGRQLLQMRLFSCLFPTSDKRHPVTSPLALLIGKYLTQCPVTQPYQAAIGLLLAGMMLHNAAAAARFCPEVVNYLAAILRAFVPVAAAGKAAAADARSDLFSPGVLALGCCSSKQQPNSSKQSSKKKARQQQQQQDDQQQQQLPSIRLYHLLSSDPDAAEFQTDEFKLQLLGCTVATAARVCQLSTGCGDAAPEVLQPLAAAAAAVASLQGLPAAAAAAVGQLQQLLQERSDAVVAARLPMVQSHRVKLVAPKEYNPRYEADFSNAANYDPDRQRAAAQKLKRQLTKEKRGAMRELRRDASFMSAERDSEKARVDAERLASEKAFYHELQVQEADAKSGGQKGMNPHKKKGKR